MADVAIWTYCDAEQRPPAVVAVGEHAADEREQHDRQLLQERVEPEEERRRWSARATSQFCATICIHVPMLDVQAPIHCTRKSR